MSIPFNKPYLKGNESVYIQRALYNNNVSDTDFYLRKSVAFFEKKYHIKKALLTKSCTAALELAAILINIKPGDEIIIPSFTYVSTANAFTLRGAGLVFADSEYNSPNIDADKIEELITKQTRAIIPVHYAGLACNMNKIMQIAEKYNLFVIEDAAHAIDSYYYGKPLGTIGSMGTFSFHLTKNITCNEGGLLAVNDISLIKRAEVVSQKGTNIVDFKNGDVTKYEWTDVGSSFQLSEILAAYLYGQLECINHIQSSRTRIWELYYQKLKPLEISHNIRLPYIPSYATNNGHIFYIVCNSFNERQLLIAFLKKHNIQASFHYLSLHKSPYYQLLHDGRDLPNSDHFSECLLRLPLYPELSEEQVEEIVGIIYSFYA